MAKGEGEAEDSGIRKDLIRKHSFKFPAPGSGLCCNAALLFDAWCKGMLAQVEQVRTVLAVNQFKLMLQDHYWHWYQTVHRTHRLRTRDEHRCIFWVYGHHYETIRALELQIVPLSTLVVNQPRAVTPTSYLGFEDDESADAI